MLTFYRSVLNIWIEIPLLLPFPFIKSSIELLKWLDISITIGNCKISSGLSRNRTTLFGRKL